MNTCAYCGTEIFKSQRWMYCDNDDCVTSRTLMAIEKHLNIEPNSIAGYIWLPTPLYNTQDGGGKPSRASRHFFGEGN